MEDLKYIIEDKTIAYLLGINNFTNPESAILELVKNAYDAQAKNININFTKDRLTITDDGIGMSSSDIHENWMHVGKSKKQYIVVDSNNNNRVLAGSKGIGRFALARLGDQVSIYSKQKCCDGICWTTDWNKSNLKLDQNISQIGTQITIMKLRDKWGKKKVESLAEFLSKTYNDTLMKITVSHPEVTIIVPKYFNSPIVGKNCLSTIDIEYNSKTKTLYTTINSDEFSEEAKEYCSGVDLNHAYFESNMLNEIQSFKYELNDHELEDSLENLGDFSAQFYFNIKPTKDDVEKFLYKHTFLPEALPKGVILYRNAFSISAYEGKKDWLGFGKRSRKSPAAASHATGSWRVRENQISGKVEIDKLENEYLVDLSNRQGLEENVYYLLLIDIILTGITEFERYRQNIIRQINKKNDFDKVVYNTDKYMLSNIIAKNPKQLQSLSEQDAEVLVNEIKTFIEENESAITQLESVEERYKYDVRILNVLSTVGLKASSIAHEMTNDKNTIAENVTCIISALKEYDMWDELSSPEKTKHAYNNVPYLLNINSEISSKIFSFINVMLSDIEKKQFEPTCQSIFDILYRIKKSWETDYAWIKININMDEDISYSIAEDVLKVIMDNLILNSIQQNERNNSLVINIKAEEQNELLYFTYTDNGKGLDEKYKLNTRKILEVHETTRRNGHGLGMWIVNNTVLMSKGNIKDINGNDGFSIEFTLGEML